MTVAASTSAMLTVRPTTPAPSSIARQTTKRPPAPRPDSATRFSLSGHAVGKTDIGVAPVSAVSSGERAQVNSWRLATIQNVFAGHGVDILSLRHAGDPQTLAAQADSGISSTIPRDPPRQAD